jgi:hypothetical protein
VLQRAQYVLQLYLNVRQLSLAVGPVQHYFALLLSSALSTAPSQLLLL